MASVAVAAGREAEVAGAKGGDERRSNAAQPKSSAIRASVKQWVVGRLKVFD